MCAISSLHTFLRLGHRLAHQPGTSLAFSALGPVQKPNVRILVNHYTPLAKSRRLRARLINDRVVLNPHLEWKSNPTVRVSLTSRSSTRSTTAFAAALEGFPSITWPVIILFSHF